MTLITNNKMKKKKIKKTKWMKICSGKKQKHNKRNLISIVELLKM